ncbi:hypothetical protein ECG_01549 [Echinococcus granulosus]|uniref:Expressed protein n=1 Tax=Echinococcus granulosus TaxID=6210 RepID=A0A068WCX4_ECHGR|nr:hypothetical protein ECG_01549 [Echinococcus granulosus]CDS15522.1 expressed protein [Echinococcus granulosus]
MRMIDITDEGIKSTSETHFGENRGNIQHFGRWISWRESISLQAAWAKPKVKLRKRPVSLWRIGLSAYSRDRTAPWNSLFSRYP